MRSLIYGRKNRAFQSDQEKFEKAKKFPAMVGVFQNVADIIGENYAS